MPGSRAPHLWINRLGERLSTTDLPGNFVLLTGPEGGKWIGAAMEVVASFSGLPLDAYRMGVDLEESEGRFPKAYGISVTGASLVRPDGFVAWRSPDDAGDCFRTLRRVMAGCLAVA